MQAADAVMTLVGVGRFGLAAEGNPLLAYYMARFGAGAALLGAKTIVVLLASFMHALEHDLPLAVLTLVYVAAAIWPWAWLLAQ